MVELSIQEKIHLEIELFKLSRFVETVSPLFKVHHFCAGDSSFEQMQKSGPDIGISASLVDPLGKCFRYWIPGSLHRTWAHLAFLVVRKNDGRGQTCSCWTPRVQHLHHGYVQKFFVSKQGQASLNSWSHQGQACQEPVDPATEDPGLSCEKTNPRNSVLGWCSHVKVHDVRNFFVVLMACERLTVYTCVKWTCKLIECTRLSLDTSHMTHSCMLAFQP